MVNVEASVHCTNVYTLSRFCIENHGRELLDLLGLIQKESNKDVNVIKEKILQVIGDDFNVICEHLDSKRDRHIERDSY